MTFLFVKDVFSFFSVQSWSGHCDVIFDYNQLTANPVNPGKILSFSEIQKSELTRKICISENIFKFALESLIYIDSCIYRVFTMIGKIL